MSLFSNLYKRRERENKHDRENFLTELFAYMLQNDDDFRLSFFNAFLEENETKELKFKVSTQESYDIKNTKNKARPDIVIEGRYNSSELKVVVFIENKLTSIEGKRLIRSKESTVEDEVIRQLPIYYNVLNSDKKFVDVKKENLYLIYLTQYFENIDIPFKIQDNLINYNQITWDRVFQHTLNSEIKNEITLEFKKYLIELGMDSKIDIHKDNLPAFHEFFNSTFRNMVGILKWIKNSKEINEELKYKFGKLEIAEYGSIFVKAKTDNYDILIGFWKGEVEDKSSFFVVCQTNNENNKTFSSLKKEMKELYGNDENWAFFEEENKFQRFKLLSELSNEESHNIIIEKFCVETLEKLKRLNQLAHLQ